MEENKKIKLVAESIEEYTSKPEDLNEGILSSPKGLIEAFLKDPVTNEKSFASAFAKQAAKVKGLSNVLVKMKLESKKFLAKQALDAMTKDPNLVAPWIVVEGGKIKRATAKALKAKNLPVGE